MEYKNKTRNNNNNLITNDVKQHYSIRKFSVGVASVLIGSTLFLGSQGQKVQAAETNKSAVVTETGTGPADENHLDDKSDTESTEPAKTPTLTTVDKKSSENSLKENPAASAVKAETPQIPEAEKASQTLTGTTGTRGNRDQETTTASSSYNEGDKTFDLTSTIANNSDQEEKNIISVTVLPNKNDGKSEFDTHLTGPVEVEGSENATNIINYYVVGDEFKNLDALITTDENGNQHPTEAAIQNSFMDGTFKVKKWTEADWSKVTAVITTMDSLKANSSISVKLKAQDPTMEDDVDKTIYMSQSTWDDTVFKKVNITRRISMVTDGGKSLGQTTQTTGTGVAIYYTNPVNGELIGKGKISPTLDEYDVPTFNGYKFRQISQHDMFTSGKDIDQWDDFEYDDSSVPIKIKTVTEINHPEAIKISARTGIGGINDTIVLTYAATTYNTGSMSGHTPMMLFANLLTKKGADSEKVVQHISTIRPGDKDSAKLTVVAYQSGIPETRPELPTYTGSVPGIPLTQPELPYKNVGVPGVPLTQPELPYKNIGIPGKPLEQHELPKFEGSVPGIPLTQPELPYKNIGVPGEPLEQPELPKIPIPQKNIPDIPNPVIPEKQVPSEPVPNLNNTPVVISHEEDTPVQSTDLTTTSIKKGIYKHSSKAIPKKYRNNRKLLPQTGERNTTAISAVGLVALSFTGLIGLMVDKKKKHN